MLYESTLEVHKNIYTLKILFHISPSPFSRLLWHFDRAQWNDIRSFYLEFTCNVSCFSIRDSSVVADSDTRVIMTGMESCIHYSTKFTASAKLCDRSYSDAVQQIDFCKELHQGYNQNNAKMYGGISFTVWSRKHLALSMHHISPHSYHLCSCSVMLTLFSFFTSYILVELRRSLVILFLVPMNYGKYGTICKNCFYLLIYKEIVFY